LLDHVSCRITVHVGTKPIFLKVFVMVYKLAYVILALQACNAVGSQRGLPTQWAAPGKNPFANLFNPRSVKTPVDDRTAAMVEKSSSTHDGNKNNHATHTDLAELKTEHKSTCKQHLCDEAAEKCQAEHKDLEVPRRVGCATYAKGFQAGKYLCKEVFPPPPKNTRTWYVEEGLCVGRNIFGELERSFLRHDLAECNALCTTLYGTTNEYIDFESLASNSSELVESCKNGCENMEISSNEVCCQAPMKNVYMTVRGLKLLTLTQIPMAMDTIHFMVGQRVAESMGVDWKQVSVVSSPSANHAFDLIATVHSANGEDLAQPKGDLQDRLRQGFLDMPAVLKAKVGRVEVTGNACIYPSTTSKA